jgi:hypothetical protein
MFADTITSICACGRPSVARAKWLRSLPRTNLQSCEIRATPECCSPRSFGSLGDVPNGRPYTTLWLGHRFATRASLNAWSHAHRGSPPLPQRRGHQRGVCDVGSGWQRRARYRGRPSSQYPDVAPAGMTQSHLVRRPRKYQISENPHHKHHDEADRGRPDRKSQHANGGGPER